MQANSPTPSNPNSNRETFYIQKAERQLSWGYNTPSPPYTLICTQTGKPPHPSCCLTKPLIGLSLRLFHSNKEITRVALDWGKVLVTHPRLTQFDPFLVFLWFFQFEKLHFHLSSQSIVYTIKGELFLLQFYFKSKTLVMHDRETVLGWPPPSGD